MTLFKIILLGYKILLLLIFGIVYIILKIQNILVDRSSLASPSTLNVFWILTMPLSDTTRFQCNVIAVAADCEVKVDNNPDDKPKDPPVPPSTTKSITITITIYIMFVPVNKPDKDKNDGNNI